MGHVAICLPKAKFLPKVGIVKSNSLCIEFLVADVALDGSLPQVYISNVPLHIVLVREQLLTVSALQKIITYL